MAKAEVPITPAVLEWAIREAGLGIGQAAELLRVSEATLEAWLDESARPGMTDLRRLAAVLRRPLATFLLPAPPALPTATIDFRHPVNADRADLDPQERLVIRDATRVQRAVGWALREMGSTPVELPLTAIRHEPDAMASRMRSVLFERSPRAFPLQGTASDAQAWWRAALEAVGALVFFLPVGEGSARGFSLWDDHAPLIVVNTFWRPEARIFTMLHELGHLVTRSNSACLEQGHGPRVPPDDPAERWCEAFAAQVLVPEHDLVEVLTAKHGWQAGRIVRDLAVSRSIARHFKVSLTAAVLRMIGIGAATWALYRSIPRDADVKRGGGGGSGETRPRTRLRQYGRRTTRVLLDAMNADILGKDDVLGYLRVGEHELDEMAA
jgi:Zn-dependent peptidase ImmA (M78 family)/transcriptional regulator with XRE-family HTH domain